MTGRRQYRGGCNGEIVLTRALIDARFPRPAPDCGPTPPLLSEPEIMALLDDALEGADHQRDDVWLFAYGSLIWKPELEFAERRVGLVRGYHRRFCLWQWRYRGTKAAPNLMLALDSGGSCRGVAYRVAAPDARGKLTDVWRREMMGDAYRPRWLAVETDDGPVEALTFVANRAGQRYAGRLPERTVADHIAAACGHRGSGAEYLLETVIALDTLNLRDGMLWRVQELVAERLTGEESG